MHYLFILISLLVIIFGLINLFRMAIFLIGSDIYSLKKHLRRKEKLLTHPTISVIIPAYNEEKSIISAISSVINNNYPQEKVQVIVVNDGSTDSTEDVARDFVTQQGVQNIKIVSQSNLGKAHALNNGAKNFSTSEFVMCLDADSYLGKDALIHAVKYFENSKVMAVAANVKVARSKGVLNLIQMFEYIICYQMKKAQTAFNIEYIIGGIGSTFRRSFLAEIGFYDGNTVTEDIDLTMKILRHGNRNVRVIYGSDIIAYTQGALTLPDLIKQRHRWKWGRYQTFLKNTEMFFSRGKKHTKSFSWFYLPFTLFCDFAFIFEPLILFYMLYIVIGFRDIFTLLSAIGAISFYTSMTILAEDTIKVKDKAVLILFAPVMYFLFYILSFVEYIALIKSLAKIHTLQKSLTNNTATWVPIKRLGFSFPRVYAEKQTPIMVDVPQEALQQLV